MNDESMPSIYEIFDYWKDEKIKEIEIVEDYYYPRCWACDKEIKHNEKSEDLKIIWNSVKCRLNRCHIIAKSLNGNNDVSNLFLLCENCHAQSPDTKDKSAFMLWVYLKRKTYSLGFNFFAIQDEIKTLIEILNIDLDEMERILKKRNEKLKDILKNDEMTRHCGSISSSSVIYLVMIKIKKMIDDDKGIF
jgi:hypothetical protein